MPLNQDRFIIKSRSRPDETQTIHPPANIIYDRYVRHFIVSFHDILILLAIPLSLCYTCVVLFALKLEIDRDKLIDRCQVKIDRKAIARFSIFSFIYSSFYFFSPRILTRDGDARPIFERLPSRGIRERIARRVTNPCRHLSVHLRADGRRASASSAAISPRDAILSRDRKISARNETGFAQMSMKCQTHAAHVD